MPVLRDEFYDLSSVFLVVQKEHDVRVHFVLFCDGVIKIYIDCVIVQIYDAPADQRPVHFNAVVVRDHLHIVTEVVIHHQKWKIYP